MAMTQRTRLVVTLGASAVLATGVALYAYYGVHEAELAETEAKEAEEKLFSFESAKVTKLVLAAKGETTTVEKKDGAWAITAPIAAAADRSVVGGVVDRLAGAKRKRVVAEDAKADPARYGLTEPRVRATVTLEDGSTHELALGGENTFDGSLFATASGSPKLFSVEGGLKSALEKGTFDLREKKLLSFEDKDVRTVRVEGSGLGYALARDDAGSWRLEEPVKDRADDQTATRILSVAKNLRATRFAAEAAADLAPFGLDAPKAKVSIATRAGASFALAFGERDGKTYARVGDGPVAEVAATSPKDLDKTVFDLRDKTVAPFDKELVAQVKVQQGGEAFVVERRKEPKEGSTIPEEKWTILSPKVAPAKRWKLSSVLHSLSTLKAATFVEEEAKDLAKYGLAEPSRTFTVYGDGGKELAKLLVGGDAEGGKVYVKSASSARVSAVDKKKVDELPKQVADVEETQSTAATEPTPG